MVEILAQAWEWRTDGLAQVVEQMDGILPSSTFSFYSAPPLIE